MLTGIFTTVIVGLLFSRLLPQKLNARQKHIAFACTFQGLDQPVEPIKEESLLTEGESKEETMTNSFL